MQYRRQPTLQLCFRIPSGAKRLARSQTISSQSVFADCSRSNPSGPKVTKSAAGQGTDTRLSVGLASVKSQEPWKGKAINDTHGNAHYSTSPPASSGIQV